MADDAFEILGVPKRAEVDPEWLDNRYHELSKKYHPDLNDGDSEKFEAANAAYQTLRSIASRLKHLRAVEFPDSASERALGLDPALMDLFAELGPAIQKADEIAREIAQAKSELTKALLADSVWETRDRLEQAGAEISARMDKLRDELGQIDSDLASGQRGAALALIDRHYQSAAFLEKWQAQVREKLMACAM